MAIVDSKQDGLLIRLPDERLPKGFDAEKEVFSLAHSGSDLVILRRRLRDAKQGGAPLRIWGDLTAFAIPDMLLLLFTNRSTGCLSFDVPDAEKHVYVQNGEIVFALSSLDDERLGECLVRMGRISQDELDLAAKRITAEQKLGKILVESDLISPKELFDGVRQQTVDIIYSLFAYTEGAFHFVDGGLEDDRVVILNLETKDIILEGMLRHLGVDGKRLTCEDVFPRFIGRTGHVDLNSDEMQLAALIAEGRSLEEIITFSVESEVQTVRMLYHLERQGLVSIAVREGQMAPLTRNDRLERTASDFNSIFMDIYSILHVKVKEIDVLARLNSFFDGMEPDIAEVFDQVRFLDDGSLPVDDVLMNLRYMERDDKVSLVIKAFNELLHFTLFEMRNYLSREDAEQLMEIVQNMELF